MSQFTLDMSQFTRMPAMPPQRHQQGRQGRLAQARSKNTVTAATTPTTMPIIAPVAGPLLVPGAGGTGGGGGGTVMLYTCTTRIVGCCLVLIRRRVQCLICKQKGSTTFTAPGARDPMCMPHMLCALQPVAEQRGADCAWAPLCVLYMRCRSGCVKGSTYRQRLEGGALCDERVQRVERVELRRDARVRQGRGARDADRRQLDADVGQRRRDVLRTDRSDRSTAARLIWVADEA